jgi:hypothetical protein
VQYLCLIYTDAEKLSQLTPGEYASVMEEVLAYRDELKASGHYIASSPLEPPNLGTTLRVRGGMMAITDGPFTETKEQVGGFYLIEASDLNDAIRVASRMPPARLGAIEVRALADISLDMPVEQAPVPSPPPAVFSVVIEGTMAL